jgi:hypothetical protein
MFDLSAWGVFEWILVGTAVAFFLGPPLILGLAALFVAPGLLGRAGRPKDGPDSRAPETDADSLDRRSQERDTG